MWSFCDRNWEHVEVTVWWWAWTERSGTPLLLPLPYITALQMRNRPATELLWRHESSYCVKHWWVNLQKTSSCSKWSRLMGWMQMMRSEKGCVYVSLSQRGGLSDFVLYVTIPFQTWWKEWTQTVTHDGWVLLSGQWMRTLCHKQKTRRFIFPDTKCCPSRKPFPPSASWTKVKKKEIKARWDYYSTSNVCIGGFDDNDYLLSTYHL